jgi:asparagine synthase (glutamine-hydrolysing)
MPAYYASVRAPGAGPAGRPVRPAGGDWTWRGSADASALFGHTTDHPRTTLARIGDWLAVGVARLDNRDEVRAWTGASPDAPELHLIAAAIAVRGPSCIRSILGDFAVVAWHAVTRETIAARDAFGVKPLYVRARDSEVAFASHAASLADSTEFDLEYIAEFILSGFDREHRTPYAGVRAVPPGHVVTVRGGVMTSTRYWSATECEPAERASVDGSVAEFRELLDRAVINNLTGAGDAWSQLSGGLDSSTLVCVADHLLRSGRVSHGLAGVITMVDTLDDEMPYARAVSEHCGIRHEAVTDYWLWQDDGQPPPVNDTPDPLYPFYARNRALCALVKSAGGRVLWSGLGPDHFLAGNLYFFADWLAQGRLVTATRELLRWSILGKKPFWRFTFENAIAPLLPSTLRRLSAPRWGQVYDWITPDFARRLDLHARTNWTRSLNVPAGRKYAGSIESDMLHLTSCFERGVWDDGIEMRYPYLYRPLVEFSLRLPRELRTQPFARKWVMREALKGILPEKVRARRGKGAISGRTRWSLNRETMKVDELIDAPFLADLGCVETGSLRGAVDQALKGDDKILFAVVRTLALESWLQVLADRWDARGAPTESVALNLVPAM